MAEENVDADVIIIGAGPAGLSAAAWCVELGLETIVFEKEAETGGQLLRIFNPVTNYIGLETVNGCEMRDLFLRSLKKRKSAVRLSAGIVEIDPVTRSVVTDRGERITARGLILATGVRRRQLNVPGETAFAGKGIIESGSNEKEKAKDKTVLITGGGDAALENALILADFASKIYVVHRRSELSARSEFAEKARRNPKIEFCLETVVSSIKGGNDVEGVELKNLHTGIAFELPVEIVLVRIGVEPNTDLLLGKIELDNNRYVLVNSNSETSAPGVYAVGDVANPVAPTISTAAGMGASAAKSLRTWLNHRVPLQ
jgi:thioredoxin reductase (NADPH)